MTAESWASSSAIRATMRGNRRTDTKPELALRSALHARGLRFRKDLRLKLAERSVRPDVVFPRARVVVFVDGCYWHSCPEHGTAPKRNSEYWVPKLQRNVERDRAQDQALEEFGWTVIRLWEHVPATEGALVVAQAVAAAGAGL